jgi:hypothetical protein
VEDNGHPDKSIWGESSLHQTRGAPRSRYSDNYRAVRALLLEGSGEIEARALVVVGEGAMSVYFVHRYLATV